MQSYTEKQIANVHLLMKPSHEDHKIQYQHQ